MAVQCGKADGHEKITATATASSHLEMSLTAPNYDNLHMLLQVGFGCNKLLYL